jgi:hypothetical protein
MLSDTFVGYLILGVALLFVLALVFALASRDGQRAVTHAAHPPRGVHLPPPSLLPAALALAGALIGAGLAFRAEDQIANLWLLVPGLVVLVVSTIAWVGAANREWRERERGPGDEGAPH